MKEEMKNFATTIGRGALDLGKKFVSEEQEKAFYDGIEEGIRRSVCMLIELKVKEDKAISVLNTVWDIPASEARSRLTYEKGNLAIKNLKELLHRSGYTATEIDEFMRKKLVSSEIRHNAKLLESYEQPEIIKAYFDK